MNEKKEPLIPTLIKLLIDIFNIYQPSNISGIPFIKRLLDVRKIPIKFVIKIEISDINRERTKHAGKGGRELLMSWERCQNLVSNLIHLYAVLVFYRKKYKLRRFIFQDWNVRCRLFIHSHLYFRIIIADTFL